MTIYFLETKKLDLLGKGLALRVRKKEGKWKVTVKERPASEKTIAAGRNLEKDKTILKKPKVSCSLDFDTTEEAVNKVLGGGELKSLFSAEQLELIGDRVPWEKVRIFPKIDALGWDLSQVKKLEAEEWDYNGQKVLELSVKAKAENATGTEKQLGEFLHANGLDPAASGGLKTEAALKNLAEQINPNHPGSHLTISSSST